MRGRRLGRLSLCLGSRWARRDSHNINVLAPCSHGQVSHQTATFPGSAIHRLPHCRSCCGEKTWHALALAAGLDGASHLQQARTAPTLAAGLHRLTVSRRCKPFIATCRTPSPSPPPFCHVQLAEGVTGIPYIHGGASVYVPPCNDVHDVLAALSARPRASHQGHGSGTSGTLPHNNTATATAAAAAASTSTGMGRPRSWGGRGSGGGGGSDSSRGNVGSGSTGWSLSRKLAQLGTPSCDRPLNIGCFVDAGDARALPRKLWASQDRMTVEACAAVARALNYPVFGVQFGSEVRVHVGDGLVEGARFMSMEPVRPWRACMHGTAHASSTRLVHTSRPRAPLPKGGMVDMVS